MDGLLGDDPARQFIIRVFLRRRYADTVRWRTPFPLIPCMPGLATGLSSRLFTMTRWMKWMRWMSFYNPGWSGRSISGFCQSLLIIPSGSHEFQCFFFELSLYVCELSSKNIIGYFTEYMSTVEEKNRLLRQL